MKPGKSAFIGTRRRRGGLLAWAALALVIFGVGAAIGWALLGSPARQLDPQRIVYGNPMQFMHDQMHYRMSSAPLATPVGAADGAVPAADLPVSYHNFGKVRQGKVASWSFEVLNTGDAPLVITSGYTTCGCTTAEISAAEIPADRSGLVTVFFDPSHNAVGSVVRRGVILETNDPQRPQIEIWIQASVAK